jgi:hypothetical protein
LRLTEEHPMKILDRQKLDVVNKTRSNIFGWRGSSRRSSILSTSRGFSIVADSPQLKSGGQAGKLRF